MDAVANKNTQAEAPVLGRSEDTTVRLSLQHISDYADEVLSLIEDRIETLRPMDDVRSIFMDNPMVWDALERLLGSFYEIDDVTPRTEATYRSIAARVSRRLGSEAIVRNPITGQEELMPLYAVSGYIEKIPNSRTYYQTRAAINHTARETIKKFARVIGDPELKGQDLRNDDPYWRTRLDQVVNSMRLLVVYPPDHNASVEGRRERTRSSRTKEFDKRCERESRDRSAKRQKRWTVELVNQNPEFRDLMIKEMISDIAYRQEAYTESGWAGLKAAGAARGKQPGGPMNDVLVRYSGNILAAVAVNMLTGCRPAELLQNKCLVSKTGTSWNLKIWGAKVDHKRNKGQEVRELTIKHNSRMIEFQTLLKALGYEKEWKYDIPETNISIKSLFEQAGITDMYKASHQFSKWYTRVTDRVQRTMIRHEERRTGIKFPGKPLSISPYSMRHLMSANLKATQTVSSEDASIALGHQSEKMKSQYGYARQAGRRNTPQVTKVTGTSPVRSYSRRQPDVLDSRAGHGRMP